MNYAEFLSLVMHCMKEMKGEGFTIQLGHLLDRVVIAEVERLAEVDADDADEVPTNAFERELPLSFFLATLSLALNSSVADRVRLLFNFSILDHWNARSVHGLDTLRILGMLLLRRSKDMTLFLSYFAQRRAGLSLTTQGFE